MDLKEDIRIYCHLATHVFQVGKIKTLEKNMKIDISFDTIITASCGIRCKTL